MSRRFKASQTGRTLRALTVDDGQSVVTGNYLKLRLDVPRPRNEWVDVRVEDAQPRHAEPLDGEEEEGRSPEEGGGEVDRPVR